MALDEKQKFKELVEKFAEERDPAKRARLKKQLARLTFGDDRQKRKKARA